MQIIILGDFHGLFVVAQSHLRSIMQVHGVPDLVVQVGDFGFFPTRPLDAGGGWELTADIPFLFIDGNHENHWILRTLDKPNWGMDETPSDDWQKTLKSWEYMPRGSIRDGILYIGGARSINTRYAKIGVNWFPEENISHEEQHRIFDAVDQYGPENIHTVISHDAPAAFDVSAGCTQTGREIIDANRKFLDAIREQVRPEQWYFGHYHHKMSGTYKGTCWRCIDMIRSSSNENDYVHLTL